MGIPIPKAGVARTAEEAPDIAKAIGYPLIVRPSYVLGGRGMEVVHDEESLRRYVRNAVEITPDRPVYIDQFLEDALECEADALSDGHEAFVPAIMEHIEQAGIHSGDSACVIPPLSIPPKHLETIQDYTRRIAIELGVVGLLNVQYAIYRDVVYILEANPRASRTVPLVSKVCDIQMARVATRLMLGAKLAELNIRPAAVPYFGVKESVFPFNMFPEVDPVLGPEMRSTGEVLGLGRNFGHAFFKAEDAATATLPTAGTVLITVNKNDRPAVLEVARRFRELGFSILATRGTGAFLAESGVPAEVICKVSEGRPHIVDAMTNQQIQLVINTPIGRLSKEDDSYIRKAAVKLRIPYITTLTAALAAAKGIAAQREGKDGVRSLQDYHKDIMRHAQA